MILLIEILRTYQIKWLHHDAMVTLSDLLSTEIEKQQLSKQIYNAWIDLLDVRCKTGYTSTPVNVSLLLLLLLSIYLYMHYYTPVPL